jgi:serine/threonine protein kinase/Tol biopolymer transport system component
MSMIGKSLVHYEISSEIGKGGMGEVYQAKDTKLGRDVAIKVLPEEFALDKDRVSRFQREAKLLASLNHPNIAAIYGLEESEGIHFLVMELIEGDTLKDRIKSGPIPVEEALKLALQMAEGLEAAHEKGVIHRDLKPANIKVTPDGKVKILDFGLAKAYVGDQENISLADSPTISAAATQQGVILGTAAYMSPEQARGKPVDRRADIWAFGVVLYEMLTGKAAFSGDDVTDTLAAVIRSEPEWKSLPANLHWRLKEVLERCLEKKARDRYSGISDARVDIKKALADPSGIFAQPISTIESRRNLGSTLFLIGAAVILVGIIVGSVIWNLRPTEVRQVMRSVYELPVDQQLQLFGGPPIDISPDGIRMVYSTREGLYLRSLDELSAKLIPGSDERARTPFFSPDSKSIAYFSQDDQKLKKIAIEGGAPSVLCDIEDFRGGSWVEEDFILYSEGNKGIMKISSSGGAPVTLIEQESEIFFDPQILSDGNSVIYTIGSSAQERIMVKPHKSGEAKELCAGSFPRYLPSGYVVYLDTENNLCAVLFDSERLEAVGEHVSMVQNVRRFAISDSGTLIYTLRAPQEESSKYTLVWVDREGHEKLLEAQPNEYNSPKISPDGKKIAILIGGLGNQDIWIWDIDRKNLTKLTLDETNEVQPVWTADSKRIIYASYHEDASRGGIYWRPADGSGSVEKLISASDRSLMPWSITRDGKTLLIQELVSWTNADIGMISMEGDYERKALLENEFSEAQPTISPDGRWLVYLSSEATGEVMEEEVYIRPFPDVDKGRQQISNGGGNCPLWSPDGKELYYLSSDNYVMAVSVKTEPTLSLGTPEPLFRNTNLGLIFGGGYPWDIHPDGDRFLMIKPPVGEGGATGIIGPREIIIVANWIEELKHRVSVD